MCTYSLLSKKNLLKSSILMMRNWFHASVPSNPAPTRKKNLNTSPKRPVQRPSTGNKVMQPVSMKLVVLKMNQSQKQMPVRTEQKTRSGLFHSGPDGWHLQTWQQTRMGISARTQQRTFVCVEKKGKVPTLIRKPLSKNGFVSFVCKSNFLLPTI